jgi:hypothetical protein
MTQPGLTAAQLAQSGHRQVKLHDAQRRGRLATERKRSNSVVEDAGPVSLTEAVDVCLEASNPSSTKLPVVADLAAADEATDISEKVGPVAVVAEFAVRNCRPHYIGLRAVTSQELELNMTPSGRANSRNASSRARTNMSRFCSAC